MRLFRFRRLGSLILPTGLRVPKVDDVVWWAPKQVGARVTKVEWDGSIVFQGGPTVKLRSGRTTPRWTVACLARDMIWDQANQWWIVGQGKFPKRGNVIIPEPIKMKAGAHNG